MKLKISKYFKISQMRRVREIIRLTERERERERERGSLRWNAVYLKAWTKKFNSNGLLMAEVMAILWAAKLAKIREFKNFIVKEDAKSCFHAPNGASDLNVMVNLNTM